MSELARTDTPLPRSPVSLPKYAKDKDREYEGDPWGQQKGETSRSFAAFTIYLELGEDRSLNKASVIYREKYGLPPRDDSSILSNWSRKHRWVERAEAYENWKDSKVIVANKREFIRTSRKHAKQAADVQELLMRPVDEARKRMAEAGENDLVASLSDEQVLKLATLFARDLPAQQEAERKALTSTGESRADPVKVKATGERVRRMLADKTLGELMERVTIEFSGDPAADASDD